MPSWKLAIQACPFPDFVRDVTSIYVIYFWQKWKTSKNSQVTHPHSETQHCLLGRILQQCLVQEDGFAGFALSPSLFHTAKDRSAPWFGSDSFNANFLLYFCPWDPPRWIPFLWFGKLSCSRYVRVEIFPSGRYPSSIISTHIPPVIPSTFCSPRALLSYRIIVIHYKRRQVLHWEWLSSNREIIPFFACLRDGYL